MTGKYSEWSFGVQTHMQLLELCGFHDFEFGSVFGSVWEKYRVFGSVFGFIKKGPKQG